MLNSKLQRIKELIQEKERIDTELAHLIGESEKPKRGRRRKDIEELGDEPTSQQ